jgi:hypothetical protein
MAVMKLGARTANDLEAVIEMLRVRQMLLPPGGANAAWQRRIREMLADGVAMIKISKTVGVGTGTVQRKA